MVRLASRWAAAVKDKATWWILCLGAARAGFNRRDLGRVRRYLRVSAKLRDAGYADPRQRPEHYFPGLSAQPWHDVADHAWTEALSHAHEIIREELEGILPAHLRRQPEDLTDNGTWDVYYLYFMGRPVEENCRRCPRTTQLVESLSGFRGTGHVYFSLLAPGTHIKPHCGPINAWLRCHLGLVVPEGCRIRVGTVTQEWREGRCLIFDDAFEHEAWNTSGETRAVLVLDFWHPDLTAAEAWAMWQIIRLSALFRSTWGRIQFPGHCSPRIPGCESPDQV